MRYLFYILIIINSYFSQSQVVYEPTYRTVYTYLSRLSQKGHINFEDLIQPISRKQILEYLLKIKENPIALTPLEKEELIFYLKEYTQEYKLFKNDSTLKSVESVKILQKSSFDRFRFVASQDKQFSLNLQPILGYNIETTNGNHSFTHRFTGFWVYGYISKHFGYSFDFRENQLVGSDIDSANVVSPKTGIIGRYRKNGMEYSDIKATMSYNWDWGTITVGKDFMPIGYGANGKIIISDKAPSFPLIRLDSKPVHWLSFNYAHIWLNSDIVDSTKIRATSYPLIFQNSDITKYIATHSVTIKPLKGLSVLLGESIIYNDQIKLAYLTPLLFFRAVSHYQGELNRSNTVSNSQLYAQVSSRDHLPNTHLYGSFYVDEISLRNKGRNQTAYNIGASVTDWPIQNLFFNTDYTKVRPYAYVHFLPMQTYQNGGYNLGHWIGPNADQWYNSIQYRIRRGLQAKINYTFLRKGEVGDGQGQMEDQGTSFLWGKVIYRHYFEANISYEPIHDFFIKVSAQRINHHQEKSENLLKNIFSFNLNYGF